MKIIKANGVDIKVPKGSAFAYETDELLPKAHMISLAVGKRGTGKSVAMTNLMSMLKFDRIFVISPTCKSNSQLMSMLDIDPDDVYEDPDDPGVVDDIITKIEEERDDLETYLEKMKQWKQFIKLMGDNTKFIPDELLMMFYENGDFTPPQHKYNGKAPFCALLVDDCQSSKLFSSKRISNLAIKHRHIGAFDGDRPSIGLSMFFLIQNYKCKSGGLDKAIRNNCTNLLVFKNKDLKELENIAMEIGGEVSKEKFMEVYETAMNDGDHAFLFIDLHKKDNHPSQFRSRFNKFIVP